MKNPELSALTKALIQDAKERYQDLASKAEEVLSSPLCTDHTIATVLMGMELTLRDRLAEINKSLGRDYEKAGISEEEVDSNVNRIKSIIKSSNSKEEAMRRIREELGADVTEISVDDEEVPDGAVVH